MSVSDGQEREALKLEDVLIGSLHRRLGLRADLSPPVKGVLEDVRAALAAREEPSTGREMLEALLHDARIRLDERGKMLEEANAREAVLARKLAAAREDTGRPDDGDLREALEEVESKADYARCNGREGAALVAILRVARSALAVQDTRRSGGVCGVVCACGPNGEPMACGYENDHEGVHSWASLPTWTDRCPCICSQACRCRTRAPARCPARAHAAARRGPSDDQERDTPPPERFELWWCRTCGEPSLEWCDPCQTCGNSIQRWPMAALAAREEPTSDARDVEEAMHARMNPDNKYDVKERNAYRAGFADGAAREEDTRCSCQGVPVVHTPECIAKAERAYDAAREDTDDAVHIAVDHGRRTLCGNDPVPRISVGPRDPRPSSGDGCWMCLLIADELTVGGSAARFRDALRVIADGGKGVDVSPMEFARKTLDAAAAREDTEQEQEDER